MQFVSEKEIEDVKAKKQKEWEKVRRPDQPLGKPAWQPLVCKMIRFAAFSERPEEEYDNRTLYEKLKAQKDRKQEEWEEQFKFSESFTKLMQKTTYCITVIIFMALTVKSTTCVVVVMVVNGSFFSDRKHDLQRAE